MDLGLFGHAYHVNIVNLGFKWSKRTILDLFKGAFAHFFLVFFPFLTPKFRKLAKFSAGLWGPQLY